MITINTLWYSLLWVAMMIAGGSCYEQRMIVKKLGHKLKTLELAGWCIVVIAMLGLVHGILWYFKLILI